jgi:hypothetical protein
LVAITAIMKLISEKVINKEKKVFIKKIIIIKKRKLPLFETVGIVINMGN